MDDPKAQAAYHGRAHEGWPLTPTLRARVAVRGVDPDTVACDDAACWCYDNARPLPVTIPDVLVPPQERIARALYEHDPRSPRQEPWDDDGGDGPLSEVGKDYWRGKADVALAALTSDDAVQEARAEAWDEGYAARDVEFERWLGMDRERPVARNPYREHLTGGAS